MPGLNEQRLVGLALDALEEAAATAHHQPVRRTWALRLALAYLASKERHGQSIPRWPFDHYWRSLIHQRPQDRWSNVNASLNAIYLAVGRKRDLQRVMLFEDRARRKDLL